jgi:hypothetical protein
MRDFVRSALRRFFSGMIVGAGMIAAVAMVPYGYAAFQTFTGVGGSFPMVGPTANFADFNNMITNMNNEVGSFLQFGVAGDPGEPQFLNAASFAANGTVATAMSSLGPPGSHTTVQKWLLVIDQAGAQFFAPLF